MDVESMLVRLTGDGSDYMAMFERVVDITATGGEEVDATVQRMATSLERQAETYGLTARQAEIYSLAMQGASRADLEYLIQLDEATTKRDEFNQALQQAAQLEASVATTSERAAKEVERLDALWDKGVISLETYERALKQVNQRYKEAEEATASLTEKTQVFANAVLTTFGALGMATSLQGAFNSFADYERNTKRLTAVIEGNGKAVGATLTEHRAFADIIASQTLTTKGSVMAMYQQTEALGLGDEVQKKVITNAVALGAATGQTAQSMIRAALALEQGNPHYVAHMLHIRGVTDQTELMAQIQKKLTSGLAMAKAEMDTSYGAIEKLKRSFLGLSIEIGRMVSDAILPLLAGVKSLVDRFNDMDAATKNLTVSVLAFLAASIAISPMWSLISGTFMRAIGPAKALALALWAIPMPFTATIAAVALVIAGIVAFVKYMGGVGATWTAIKDAGAAAWGWIKAKVEEFWVWFKPVWDAFKSLMTAVWRVVASAAAATWGAIKQSAEETGAFIAKVWSFVTMGATVNWGRIREVCVDTLLFIEYSLTHFKDVALLSANLAALGFVKMFNIIEHFLLVVLPAAAKFFFSQFADATENLKDNIKSMLGDALDSVQGKRPKFAGAKDLFPDFAAPKREIGEFEKELERIARKQGELVANGFDAWKKARIAEPGGPEEKKALANAEQLGAGIGATVFKHAKHGIDKVQGALYGSAEGIAHFRDYLDHIYDTKKADPSIAAAKAAKEAADLGEAKRVRAAAEDKRAQADQIGEAMKNIAKVRGAALAAVADIAGIAGGVGKAVHQKADVAVGAEAAFKGLGGIGDFVGDVLNGQRNFERLQNLAIDQVVGANKREQDAKPGERDAMRNRLKLDAIFDPRGGVVADNPLVADLRSLIQLLKAKEAKPKFEAQPVIIAPAGL